MAKQKGSRNIVPFQQRTELPTTKTRQVLHLSSAGTKTVAGQFHDRLRNQVNYLNWIDSRHQELIEARRSLAAGRRGPKDAVYRKYKWYAEQQCLLEAVAAFEVFYKDTFVAVVSILKGYIPPDTIRGTIDARTLWVAQRASIGELLFAGRSFLNLREVDKAAEMLLGARRYEPNNPSSAMQPRVKALKAAFQVRHTLAHNQGRVSEDDRAKLLLLGYSVRAGEVLDPEKDRLGKVVRDLLSSEASEFTVWVLEKIAELLAQRSAAGITLRMLDRVSIDTRIGFSSAVWRLNWR